MASVPSPPGRSGPQLQLRTAQLSDLPAIARAWQAAFFDDEIIGKLMHPHRNEHPEDVYWFLLRGLRERFWDWRHQFVVVTAQEGDGQERIAGAADWRRLGEGGKRRELARVDPRTYLVLLCHTIVLCTVVAHVNPRLNCCISFLPSHTNLYGFSCVASCTCDINRGIDLGIGNLVQPALNAYHALSLRIFPNRAADPSNSSWLDAAVASSEKFWVGERAECWDLHVCGVHPDFQGKGVGKLLVRWGVEQAESENAVASVLCGEKNRGFYGKGGLTVLVNKSENGIALFTR